jgi:Flp pilus assembly protein TadG
MGLLKRLSRNQRGAAALEFIIIAPALILMIVGIARLGILFMANAGLRNAVAEGARFATISPRPTDTQIRSRITSSQFGLNAANFSAATISSGQSGGLNYLDITASYSVPMDFVFFSAGSVTLTETRRAFVRPLPPSEDDDD